MGALVLGIDAGFTATGLVLVELRRESDVVVSAWVIRTVPTAKKRGVRVADDDAERCMALARSIVEWVPAEVRSHGACVVELPSGGAQGARPNRAMGMATGMIAATVALQNWPTLWVTPDAVKRAATGRSKASKEEVAEAVGKRLEWVAAVAESVRRRPAVEREHLFDAAGAFLAGRDDALIQALRGMKG